MEIVTENFRVCLVFTKFMGEDRGKEKKKKIIL